MTMEMNSPNIIADMQGIGLRDVGSQHPLSFAMQEQVMTEEQLETLRRQISVYATICQQLVHMHRAVVLQMDPMRGMPLGQAIAFDSLMGMAGQRVTARQRWTPSQVQLQILEKIFDQDKGTPSKQKIKEITAELSQHGHISETNVYNWFQNRRARTKRKQQIVTSNSGESEMDNSLDSSKGKQVKMDENIVQETQLLRQSSVAFQGHENVPKQQKDDTQQCRSAVSFSSQASSNALIDFAKNASFEQGFSETRNGQLMDFDKPMENSNTISTGEGYMMIGDQAWLQNDPIKRFP